MPVRAGLLCALALIALPGTAFAEPPPQDLSCGGAQSGSVTISDLWPGAPNASGWRNDTQLSAVVAAAASRSVQEADAQQQIGQLLANTAPTERRVRAMMLATGIVDSINSERRQIINGIGRFKARQNLLARRIESVYGQLDDPLPANADQAARDARAALEDQAQWDSRTLEDRRRLLPIICRQPAILQQRAGSLVAGLRARFDTPYRLYVTNEHSGDISIIDPVQRAEIGRFATGKRPRGLVVSPDQRTLYVAVSGSPIAGPGVDEDKLPPPDKAADGIAVIDLATHKLLRTLGGVSDPEQISISPDGSRLYVTSEDSGQLVAMSKDGRILARAAVGDQPEGIAVSADGRTLLVTSEGSNSVAVIDARTMRVTHRVPVGERPRNALFLGGEMAAIPGELDSSISIIDLTAGKLIRMIKLNPDDRPMGLVALTDGQVVVSTGRGGRLIKLDPRDGTPPIGSGPVGKRPWGLTLSPDRALAYTANGPSNDIAAVDAASLTIMGNIPVSGDGPWGIAAVRISEPNEKPRRSR